MADTYNIYKKCVTCGGTGEITINDETYDPGPPSTVTCNVCGGTGQRLWGRMIEEEE